MGGVTVSGSGMRDGDGSAGCESSSEEGSAACARSCGSIAVGCGCSGLEYSMVMPESCGGQAIGQLKGSLSGLERPAKHLGLGFNFVADVWSCFGGLVECCIGCFPRCELGSSLGRGLSPLLQFLCS